MLTHKSGYVMYKPGPFCLLCDFSGRRVPKRKQCYYGSREMGKPQHYMAIPDWGGQFHLLSRLVAWKCKKNLK